MLKERQVFCPDKLRTSSIMQCNYERRNVFKCRTHNIFVNRYPRLLREANRNEDNASIETKIMF